MVDHPESNESATGSDEKNPHAVALGRLGGLKGGKIAAENMTPAQRQKRARKAAKARWKKQKTKRKK